MRRETRLGVFISKPGAEEVAGVKDVNALNTSDRVKRGLTLPTRARDSQALRETAMLKRITHEPRTGCLTLSSRRPRSSFSGANIRRTQPLVNSAWRSMAVADAAPGLGTKSHPTRQSRAIVRLIKSSQIGIGGMAYLAMQQR